MRDKDSYYQYRMQQNESIVREAEKAQLRHELGVTETAVWRSVAAEFWRWLLRVSHRTQRHRWLHFTINSHLVKQSAKRLSNAKGRRLLPGL
jgi:hypothetical protein